MVGEGQVGQGRQSRKPCRPLSSASERTVHFPAQGSLWGNRVGPRPLSLRAVRDA
jgi:hypothetical protein